MYSFLLSHLSHIMYNPLYFSINRNIATHFNKRAFYQEKIGDFSSLCWGIHHLALLAPQPPFFRSTVTDVTDVIVKNKTTVIRAREDVEDSQTNATKICAKIYLTRNLC